MSIDCKKPHITYAFVVDENETVITKEFDCLQSLIKFINLEFTRYDNITYFNIQFDTRFQSSLKLSDNLGFWHC